LQFQYSLFSRKDFNKLCKEKPKIDFVLLNLPPAFIYETTKYSENKVSKKLIVG
jgi:phospholipid N-methyltransferase